MRFASTRSTPEEFSALMVAEKIGLPAEQVFKTLLCVTSEREHVFAVVPGDAELDFKKLAAAAGTRKAEMVSLKDVQPLTGYVRGGVTVFGAKKDFPVYVDETVELFDVVSVSAGTRGVQVVLSPADYLRAAKATVADLTKDRDRVRQERAYDGHEGRLFCDAPEERLAAGMAVEGRD